jgi:hypothetical protein
MIKIIVFIIYESYENIDNKFQYTQKIKKI